MSATYTIPSVLETLALPEAHSPGQREAREFLLRTGIPTRKSEDWRYTPIKRLFDGGLKQGQAAPIDGATATRFRPVTDFHTRSFIPALCVAGSDGTATVHLKDGETKSLILSSHSGSNTLWTRHTQIAVKNGNSATLVLRSKGGMESSLLADFVEMELGRDAALNLIIIEENVADQALSIAVKQAQGSQFTATTITLGGSLVRNELNVALEGPRAECHLFGLYLANGTDLIDNHTLVDHRVPDCTSNELYKGVMAGKSTGVFNGKVYVQRDAQRTNGFQQNRNIIIGDHATMNSKPELEIYADDVKCSHGSTTGQLDDEALFYLRSRGLSVAEATGLLLGAFAEDVLASVKDNSVRNELTEKIGLKVNSLR